MSQPNKESELEAYKEKIINDLTPEQEDELRNIHAESYSGTDDDMTDNYEKWLMDLTVMDLESYLEL